MSRKKLEEFFNTTNYAITEGFKTMRTLLHEATIVIVIVFGLLWIVQHAR